ncbi:TPA: hypothetical protein KKX32_000365 [Legionella pneumophila]|jgi:aminoglycoside 6'-N-acetyltransferase|uniref:hypothetical protein n=1 Tax=Legionella pneumophila TaxID=446 RepID=UPI00077C9A73|nr:hypothetical protein [Legionella pneumophila]AMQ28329.1 hypothetical protein lpt_10190 [Legionella pneumophila subsp. pneumophila]MBN5929580.1 hypothetical protein [Legionella pneumophila]MDW8967253.1 hypothetical protein [Legionella pneumophila]MDW9135192.1 hypothetical protein [Legionella pneumophila]MDW9141383.1 hypothetical protein [Legionella pneumophila]
MRKNNIILLMGIAGTGKRTIGEEIVAQDNTFRLAHHHDWIDPILKLLGSDASVFWSLDEKGWSVLNQARDVIFNTIAEVAPQDSNFVITNELLANNPWHQEFFNKVLATAKKRQSNLVPVRLVCELDELINRVRSPNRKKYYKTQDVALIQQRFKDDEVFYSSLPTEYTLDVTHLTPKEAAEKILHWLDKQSKEQKS